MTITIGEYQYTVRNYPVFVWSPEYVSGEGRYEKCWAVYWLGLVISKDRPEAME